MYAVVTTGGKQYRVQEGQTLKVERLGQPGEQVDLVPVLLVDDGAVLATPSQLAGVTVSARIVEETKGRKIDGFVYKPKSNNRRRFGHRQTYATIEITGIERG
jgi:large subunit ribosomal protein L21